MKKTLGEIESKFDNIQEEIGSIVKMADDTLLTEVSGLISFEYQHSAIGDFLTDFERAQSICFVTRYETLPVFDKAKAIERNGKYFLGNYTFVRHVLNEYRPIIQNQKDSVYYKHIHRFCREKLINRNPSKGLSITIDHKDKGDITESFFKALDEKCKAIKLILKKCEYEYIYNGILQHSDHKFTERFLEEYNSGEINYIFIKHAHLLVYIKDLLNWHYRLLNAMTFPKLGPL